MKERDKIIILCLNLVSFNERLLIRFLMLNVAQFIYSSLYTHFYIYSVKYCTNSIIISRYWHPALTAPSTTSSNLLLAGLSVCALQSA